MKLETLVLDSFSKGLMTRPADDVIPSDAFADCVNVDLSKKFVIKSMEGHRIFNFGNKHFDNTDWENGEGIDGELSGYVLDDDGNPTSKKHPILGGIVYKYDDIDACMIVVCGGYLWYSPLTEANFKPIMVRHNDDDNNPEPVKLSLINMVDMVQYGRNIYLVNGRSPVIENGVQSGYGQARMLVIVPKAVDGAMIPEARTIDDLVSDSSKLFGLQYGARYLAIHGERLFAAYALDNPNTLCWSEPYDPLNWSPAYGINYDNVGQDDGEFITGIASLNENYVYVFKMNNVYRYLTMGGIEQWASNKVDTHYGTYSHKTIKLFEGSLVYLSPSGIAMLNGNEVRLIDEQIQNKTGILPNPKALTSNQRYFKKNEWELGTFIGTTVENDKIVVAKDKAIKNEFLNSSQKQSYWMRVEGEANARQLLVKDFSSSIARCWLNNGGLNNASAVTPTYSRDMFYNGKQIRKTGKDPLTINDISFFLDSKIAMIIQNTDNSDRRVARWQIMPPNGAMPKVILDYTGDANGTISDEATNATFRNVFVYKDEIHPWGLGNRVHDWWYWAQTYKFAGDIFARDVVNIEIHQYNVLTGQETSLGGVQKTQALIEGRWNKITLINPVTVPANSFYKITILFPDSEYYKDDGMDYHCCRRQFPALSIVKNKNNFVANTAANGDVNNSKDKVYLDLLINGQVPLYPYENAPMADNFFFVSDEIDYGATLALDAAKIKIKLKDFAGVKPTINDKATIQVEVANYATRGKSWENITAAEIIKTFNAADYIGTSNSLTLDIKEQFLRYRITFKYNAPASNKRNFIDLSKIRFNGFNTEVVLPVEYVSRPLQVTDGNVLAWDEFVVAIYGGTNPPAFWMRVAEQESGIETATWRKINNAQVITNEMPKYKQPWIQFKFIINDKATEISSIDVRYKVENLFFDYGLSAITWQKRYIINFPDEDNSDFNNVEYIFDKDGFWLKKDNEANQIYFSSMDRLYAGSQTAGIIREKIADYTNDGEEYISSFTTKRFRLTNVENLFRTIHLMFKSEVPIKIEYSVNEYDFIETEIEPYFNITEIRETLRGIVSGQNIQLRASWKANAITEIHRIELVWEALRSLLRR
jgi:hypothetical protein